MRRGFLLIEVRLQYYFGIVNRYMDLKVRRMIDRNAFDS